MEKTTQKLRTLIAASLPEALSAMNVGETCYAPVNYTPETVRKTCAELKSKGFMFSTTSRTGRQTITRLR